MTQPALNTQVSELTPDSGVSAEGRQQLAGSLARGVADTYRLMIDTQGVHWNVQGPLFYSVHKLTEEQYRDMFEAADDLAERIRALGHRAPHNVAELSELTDLESPDPEQKLHEQIGMLIRGNEQIAQRMRGAVPQAENNEDVKTADLLTERIGLHEEHAWMLRATIAA